MHVTLSEKIPLNLEKFFKTVFFYETPESGCFFICKQAKTKFYINIKALAKNLTIISTKYLLVTKSAKKLASGCHLCGKLKAAIHSNDVEQSLPYVI